MNNEKDLSKYETRTDLAVDYLTDKKLDGVRAKTRTRDGITITKVYLNKKNILNKKQGKYITLEFDDCTDTSNKEKIVKILIMELRKMFKFKEDENILIVGLGNISSTPDSLGPSVINEITITNHIYLLDNLSPDYRRVSAIAPGVMGTTGIETSEIIEGIVKRVEPTYLIVIDSLASSSIERLNKTIQITDTGISPGSGIGNKRKEISFDTLGIPVVAIGVPTVVDASVIVSDTINFIYKNYAFNKDFLNSNKSKLTFNNVNYLNYNIKENIEDKKNLLGMLGTLDDVELRRLVYEVLNPIGYNLLVTQSEIDYQIKELSNVISKSLNISLHKNIKQLENINNINWQKKIVMIYLYCKVK